MNMTRETVVNSAVLALLVLVPVVAQFRGDPFAITLATKVAIFALAGVGLNLALGFGGLISFGHAAFFGLGGYVTGILASHAANFEPLFSGAFTVNGTQQMLIIWPIAMLVAGLFAVVIGALSLRTSGVFFIMLTLAFSQMIYYFAVSWPSYGGEDGLSFYTRNQFPRPQYVRSAVLFLDLLHAADAGADPLGGNHAVALRAGAWRRAAKPATHGQYRHPAVLALAHDLRDFRDDHGGACRIALCGSKPFRQPRDVELAYVGRDHDLRHSRRQSAALGACRGGGGSIFWPSIFWASSAITGNSSLAWCSWRWFSSRRVASSEF